MDKAKIRFLRMQRQFFTIKANEQDYLELYRDMQPGQNVYWNGFGQPPTLTPRPDFDDLEFNRRQQLDRQLIKGRFAGAAISVGLFRRIWSCSPRCTANRWTRRTKSSCVFLSASNARGR